MNVSIRLATLEELDATLLLVRFFHQYEHLEITEEERESVVRKLLENAALGGIWLIYNDHTLVGYITLCIGFSIEFAGFDAFVDEFYIDVEYRGRGVGRQVLELIKAAAKDLDVKALHLEVARDNKAARKLYGDAGFRLRDRYVLMSMELR